MTCPKCEVWELCGAENFCSWCGLAFLDFRVEADRSTLPATGYPPPLQLTVSNLSVNREIDIESIASSAAWITLLDPRSVPRRMRTGEQATFLLDVDSIAASIATQVKGEVQVQVAHAGARSIALEIV